MGFEPELYLRFCSSISSAPIALHGRAYDLYLVSFLLFLHLGLTYTTYITVKVKNDFFIFI